MKQKKIQELAADISKLVRQMQPVIEKAEALGIFTNDRELLECPNCGMKMYLNTSQKYFAESLDRASAVSFCRWSLVNNESR
jgi:hypothetical protein